jgi:membrane associated rhomboid family serine protease
MQQRFSMLPEVVKNLLIINVLMYIASLVFPTMQHHLALYPFSSEAFQPYQLLSHMFMHGSPTHIFFNMFALFMFGRDTEYTFGAKKFLLFYFVTGLGAALLHQLANYAELQYALSKLTPEHINEVYTNGLSYLSEEKNFRDETLAYANIALNRPAVGASGAVFGILAAFGMLYPNRMIMLLIPPIPMKAKYFVLIMGALELYLGFSQHQSGVAHFAHVGGALFGFLMILYWRSRGEKF